MTYLLDTHTFLWILDAPQSIPAIVKRICEDRSSVLALSIVTPWEMAIKGALGKLDAYLPDRAKASTVLASCFEDAPHPALPAK